MRLAKTIPRVAKPSKFLRVPVPVDFTAAADSALRCAGTATPIYAEAYNKAAEFYSFVRSLQSYELFLGKRSTLLLSADSPLFRYLAGPRPEGDALLSDKPSVSAQSTETASK
jgi:hypothetical protein